MELPQSLQPPPPPPPPSSSSSFSSSLPPGCRFSPSDEQLLRFYLSNKASGHNDCNLIKDLNPFDYDPFDLPDSACFSYGSNGRKKHWYYYAVTAFRENRGWIRMKSGYWRRKGRVKEVTGHPGVVLGMKRTFVFYLGNSIKKALKTNWIMYEYALDDHFKASLVLHRVFVSGRGNRISGNGLSSYGDGSVSAVCHNGNQQDGIQVNNVVDAEPCEGDAMDTTNVISRHETGRAENSNCLLVIDPFSAPAATTLQVPSKACPCEMMTSSPVTPPGTMPAHVIDKQQLISILEGDFLELADLVE
ncbi:protein CUP-SHAPED COTYLEDON 3-like [Cucumis melo var. makuwa]|uniref:Protein CUP-SHAPED COTYLEDON 3-like n=2 Tax=Cucumis melo TaxID=3656 RepID=A0A5A7VBJ1_CUCMM|nr:protein CUP-SHAPED COTYLEDON 3-like [Cucumis melo var. makuwa]TYK20190.1 protein CUP-SHAPED COTYLEDON 3-like [Cucumis melo var. makuwa]